MRRSHRLLLAVAAALLAVVPAASALDIEGEPKTLADGVVGQSYHHQFIGEEGCPPSYDFHLHSGSLPLPPGLSIDRRTGVLSGTPTTPGDYHFFVELTDGDGGPDSCQSTPSQADFYLRVLPRLEITGPPLGPVRVGTALNVQLVAAGGGDQFWSVGGGSLPPGLTLSEKGVLAGVATAAGAHTFTLRVQDPGPKRVATKEVTLVVATPVAASVASSGSSEVGVPFAARLATSGGAAPYTWSVAEGALPAGLTLDPATGAITGTPSAAGRFAATLQVTDAVGHTATTGLGLSVAARLAIATRTIAIGTARRPFRARLVARGGVAPLRWTIRGRLPTGLRFNARTAMLAGTPRSTGTSRITITVRDALGVVSSRAFRLTTR